MSCPEGGKSGGKGGERSVDSNLEEGREQKLTIVDEVGSYVNVLGQSGGVDIDSEVVEVSNLLGSEGRKEEGRHASERSSKEKRGERRVPAGDVGDRVEDGERVVLALVVGVRRSRRVEVVGLSVVAFSRKRGEISSTRILFLSSRGKRTFTRGRERKHLPWKASVGMFSW